MYIVDYRREMSLQSMPVLLTFSLEGCETVWGFMDKMYLFLGMFFVGFLGHLKCPGGA